MQINNDVRLYCGDCTHIMDSNSEYAVKAFGNKSIVQTILGYDNG